MKIKCIIILLFISNFTLFGETKIVSNLTIDENVRDTKSIIYLLIDGSDTLDSFILLDFKKQNKSEIFIKTEPKNNYTLIFKYLNNDLKWNEEKHRFTTNGKEDSIICDLNFTRNEEMTEYLKYINVLKYQPTDSVEVISDWQEQVGSQPKYLIINKSNKLLFGKSFSGQFYGAIYKYEDDKWIQLTTGFESCPSNNFIDPIKKGDTATTSDIFKITEWGEYKFVIYLGLQDWASLYIYDKNSSKKAVTKKQTHTYLRTEKIVNVW